MKALLRMLLIAATAQAATAASQDFATAAPLSLTSAKDQAISRRVMLNVAQPAETLATPAIFYGPVHAPPGTSVGAAVAGNIIAMLIIKGVEDAKERKTAEFAGGLNRVLANMDVRRELADQLRKELERSGYLKGAWFEMVNDVSDLEQPGLLIRIPEREIYTVDVRCVFDREMASLHMFTDVRLWHKGGFKPAHTTRLQYVSKRLPQTDDTRPMWMANEGALLRQALMEGITETARMFMFDTAMREKDRRLPPDPINISWIAPETGKFANGSLYPLRESEDRVLGQVRTPADQMVSVPREHASYFEVFPKIIEEPDLTTSPQ